MKTFKFYEEEIPYIQQQDEAEIGERTIEVPIALKFIETTDHCYLIEVGAVTPYWVRGISHTVIDPFDDFSGCHPVDFEQYKIYPGLFDILCISSLEHFGTSDYGNKDIDPEKSIRCFNKIIHEARKYFITIPIGYNTKLDNYIKQLNLRKFFYKRINDKNEWIMSDDSCWECKYNDPFIYANGVAFITNTDL